MPLYVSKHARLVVGDVHFHPNAVRDEDRVAAAAAVRALYVDDPGEDVAFGASYDDSLAGHEHQGVDYVELPAADDKPKTKAEEKAEAKAEKADAKADPKGDDKPELVGTFAVSPADKSKK